MKIKISITLLSLFVLQSCISKHVLHSGISKGELQEYNPIYGDIEESVIVNIDSDTIIGVDSLNKTKVKRFIFVPLLFFYIWDYKWVGKIGRINISENLDQNIKNNIRTAIINSDSYKFQDKYTLDIKVKSIYSSIPYRNQGFGITLPYGYFFRYKKHIGQAEIMVSMHYEIMKNNKLIKSGDVLKNNIMPPIRKKFCFGLKNLARGYVFEYFRLFNETLNDACVEIISN